MGVLLLMIGIIKLLVSAESMEGFHQGSTLRSRFCRRIDFALSLMTLITFADGSGRLFSYITVIHSFSVPLTL